ncbi:conjugal transfer protein TraF [Rhodanobacter denitrificans]|uniref:conjugal transfer protein TraF n=1 Tax=Rhodanobacter denitrificans TaxID=666685 RepID=UPI001F1B40E1|nr:conjugal transfer protein TraF [Rhodanobacter denitrificans]UJJ60585.1 conjugal transfer protein TraF [Rhodanobacter denitrificans]
MRALSIILPVLLALAGVHASASAQDAHSSAGVSITPPERGWFFYHDPKPEPPKAKPKKPQPSTATAAPTPPRVGSAAWIAANIDRIREEAIDDPTNKAKMELYAYVQKLAMDKSEVFANAYIRTMSSNPSLDETISNPTSSFALREMGDQREANMQEVLKKIAAETSLWYFFRSDCPYCHRENPLLGFLQRDTGISILPISLDRKPMQDGSFPDWIPDAGQGAFLNIASTPTIYLVHPATQKVASLSVGLRSLPDLQRRIVEIAREQNWIDEADYQRAMRGTPQRFLTTTFDPSSITDPSDPAQVLQALRAAGTHGATEAAGDLHSINEASSANSTPWTEKE